MLSVILIDVRFLEDGVPQFRSLIKLCCNEGINFLLTNLTSIDEAAMQYPFSRLGIFLGYCDHSTAIRQTNGEAFSWQRIESVRDSIRERCRQLSPKRACENTFVPQFASCFGHSDDIMFMLVDSFLDAVHLTSGIPQVENYTMANWYMRDFFPEEDRRIIIEPPDWVPLVENRYSQPPLKMISHFKLSGMLSIGFGLHAQLAAATLILRTIREVVETLRALPLRNEHKRLFAAPKSGIDLFESFRVSMLAPVGSDDIVLVSHSHNYSLSASILAAVRCLTIGQLFEWSVKQRNSLSTVCNGQDVFMAQGRTAGDSSTKFLSLFAQLASGQAITTNPHLLGLPDQITHNHLLAASFTTLAVSEKLSNFQEISQTISGFASVQANADINPGHELEAGDKISKKWKNVNKSSEPFQLSENRFVLPGKHDLSMYFTDSPERQEQSCIPLTTFFEFTQSLFESSAKLLCESGFQDISTNLAIPIPRIGRIRDSDNSQYVKLHELLESPIDDEKHANTMNALEAITSCVCSEYLLDHPQSFEQMLVGLELNPSVRAAAHRLFAEFAEALGDPIHFDSVIDLSDAFRALFRIMEHKSLARKYPNLSAAEEPNDRLESHKTRAFFVEAIDGLVQSLLLRTGNSSVKREQRFGDLQGSISSLLGAGDTAIKSSLGILRHRVSRDLPSYGETRRTITGVIVPTLRQRPTAKQFVYVNMGLTLVKMDRMHVFNPTHLVRVLHEVAHLYFDKLVRAKCESLLSTIELLPTAMSGDDDSPKRFFMLQASELFAEKVTQSIIFGADFDLFVKNQLRDLAVMQTDLTDEDLEDITIDSLILPKIQVLYRLFLVGRMDYMTDTKEESAASETTFQDFARQWIEWLDIPDEIGQERFLASCTVWARAFAVVIPSIISMLREEIDKTRVIVASLEQGSWTMPELRLKVESILKENTPLPLAELSEPVYEGLAVFSLIYAFVKCTSDIDSTPSDREQAFGLCTNVIKSLWHISTRQKRRRLAEILEAASLEV